MSTVIPRKDIEDKPSPGMGNAYVEFYTLEEAKEARRVSIIYLNAIATYRKEIQWEDS